MKSYRSVLVSPFTRILAMCVLAVLVGLFVGVNTSKPASAIAEGRACIRVNHYLASGNPAPPPAVNAYTVAAYGQNGTTYKVEYRLARRGYPTQWSQWLTIYSPTGEISDATCTYGTYRWLYRTPGIDYDYWNFVEWRVTSNGHAGTHCITGASLTSIPTVNTKRTVISRGASCPDVLSTPNSTIWYRASGG